MPAPDNSPRPSNNRATLPPANSVPLAVLLAYAEEVLSELAENRDLRSEDGKPCYWVRSSGEDRESSWVHFTADFSGLGMAIDMPLIATAYSDEASIEWNFRPTPIAKTPRSATAKEAASVLNMDTLLGAFRRFVEAESVLFPTSATRDAGKGRGPVYIALEDGSCRRCEGLLEVTGVDDATMQVECSDCGDTYELEHDAFDGGATDYVLEFLSRRGREEET